MQVITPIQWILDFTSNNMIGRGIYLLACFIISIIVLVMVWWFIYTTWMIMTSLLISKGCYAAKEIFMLITFFIAIPATLAIIHYGADGKCIFCRAEHGYAIKVDCKVHEISISKDKEVKYERVEPDTSK